MLNLAKVLFKTFNEHCILYCNWKGTSKIEDGLEGTSDIDILLSEDSATLASLDIEI